MKTAWNWGCPHQQRWAQSLKRNGLNFGKAPIAKYSGYCRSSSSRQFGMTTDPELRNDFHLYRSIIPSSSGNGENEKLDRSIAYIGFLRIAHSTIVFEAQALWAAAYLQGHLDVPKLDDREHDTALFNAWVRRRYLYGRKIPYALNAFLPVSLPAIAPRVLTKMKCVPNSRSFSMSTCSTATWASLHTGKEG